MATEIEQLEGRREPMVPVYHFGGGNVKYERANHNPFKDIVLDDDSNDE